MNIYVLGPLAESAYHLLTVIDFLCLAGGTYLLLIMHDRSRRSGHLLIAAGLAVLTLQIIPEHLSATAPRLRYAGATLSLGVACILIVAGTLTLIESEEKFEGGAVKRLLLVLAATMAVLGTFFVWALPFWEPLRTIIRTAGPDSAFSTFQHLVRVGVASAFLACTWISWERRILGTEASRMFGAAYVCWAIFLILGVTELMSPERAFWTAKGVKVLGSLFVGNALVLYVYGAERAAAERQKRLALIDRVTTAAIAAPRLYPMIEASTDQMRDLLRARVAATYLVDHENRDRLRLTYSTDERVDLPESVPRDEEHPVSRALMQRELERLTVACTGERGEQVTLPAVATPLTGVSRAVGVMLVGMSRGEELSPEDMEALHNAGAQLGVIVQNMILFDDTRQARDRWRQTFDSITEVLTVHDTDGRIIAANRAATALAGISELEAIGRTLCQVFGSDCEEQEEMLNACVRTPGLPGTGMHRARGRVYQVQVTPLRNDDQQISGCVRVARDVTSRWRAEERLAQSERRYRELAENANDIIYTHDLDGSFIYVNPAAVRILGYSQEQLSHLKFWDIVAPESMSKARAYVEKLLDGELDEDQIEIRMTCADDRVAVVQLRANLLARTGQTEVIHGIARDVTAEKQLTTQLIQADRLASVGTLIAGIAHELNNPLTAIGGYADMLAEEEREGMEGDAIRTIAEEAERCRDVAQNLLNFARQTDSRLMEFDLNALLRGVVDLRAYDLRAANIDLKMQLQEDLPPVVGEYGQIQQVIYNIVDNAYYVLQREGGGSLEVATWAEGDRLHLRVADSGPGIPEALLGRIFEPFVTTKPRGEGTGLGLSICRRILEAHGGAITAGNRPGGGASFDALIPASDASPRKESEAAVEVEAEPEQPHEPVAGIDGTARVLFIDDEPSLCALVKEYLSRRGHDVTVAQTGEHGLEIALEDEFDVIVCDMRLPGMTGEDVCSALLDEKPRVAERIIVATGDILSPQTQSFFDRTGLPHIHKPFKLDQLEAEIARLVARHPAHEG